MEKVKLVIGLGNPGKEYEKTYHSAGFLFVDYLTALSLRGAKRRGNLYKIASPSSGARNDETFAMTPLLKTDVYMNQSGNFVKAALKKYKTKPEEILVVHDDSDIELGKYKISFGRGSAGHRGIESIIDALKTKNFWRLRIGIRPPTVNKISVNQFTPTPKFGVGASQRKSAISRRKASELVLKKIGKKDLKVFEKVFQSVIANDPVFSRER